MSYFFLSSGFLENSMGLIKMKNIFFYLLVFSAACHSCEKCQECTTKVSQNSGGVNQSSTSTQNYCGADYTNAPTPTAYSQTNAGITENVEIICQDQ